jgi:hypothetical protein
VDKPWLTCRRLGHDYGEGAGVLPEIGVGDPAQTCQVCGTSRERGRNGLLTYHAPPELMKWPLGEVK